jgi:histone-lysine N-methyltransferase SUV420H
MSRYLELYLPSGSIEITQTSRYSHKTGKSELCVIAVRPLKPGQTITDLKGTFCALLSESLIDT